MMRQVCEWARQEQVLDGLWVLVAEEAFGVVLQAALGKSLCRPASVLVGEPVEEFDAGRRPTLPDELPGGTASGS